MAAMIDDAAVRDAPDGARTGKVAHVGDVVTIVETKDDWVHIKIDDPATEGWVPKAAVDAGAAGPAAAPINRQNFANFCVQQGLIDGVNPHYLVGVAQLRSGITDGSEGDRVGPFRLTADEWKTVTPPYDASDRTSPNQQIGGFSLMVKQRMAALGLTATPVQLYRSQWPDTDAATIGDKLKAAFDATVDIEVVAEAAVLDAPAEPDADPPTPAGQFGNAPSGMQISTAAYNLILSSEVSGQAAYNKRFRRPEWPGGKSGVTIGIGYDVGYASAEEINNDWQELGAAMIASLQGVRGRKGASAQAALGEVPNVDVPWEFAIKVHQKTVIPRWVGKVARALSNTEKLSKDCLGALVSLTYNRGEGIYSLPGDRFSEGRAIKQAMQGQNFGAIPDLFRSMSRLWPGANERGLPIRRENEAKLFQAGIGKPAGT